MVKATTILFKAAMMVTPKPTFVVHVAATISLTIASPVPSCLVGLLTPILILPTVDFLLSLGALPLLTLGLSLLLGALLLLTFGVLLLLGALLLPTLGVLLRFLLLFGLSLMLLFRSVSVLLVLVLPCVSGSDGSEKKQ